ncbi:MAG: hypothetical protein AB8B60_20965 [Sulfitobacter sp.]
MKTSNVLEQQIGKGEFFGILKGEPIKKPDFNCGDPQNPCRERFGLDDLLGKPSGAMTRVVAS